MVDEVAEDVVQPPQRRRRPRQPQRPPPDPLQSHRQYVAERVPGDLQAAVGRLPVDFDPGSTKLLQILGIVFDRCVPHAGPGVVGTMIHDVHAPVVRGHRVGNVEKGLDRLVVAHLVAPEDLLAQIHFPSPCQLALALHPGLGDDLVPAVLGIAEHQRPCFSQHVQARPEPADFMHPWAVGDLRHPLGKRPEDLPVFRRHRQIVGHKPGGDLTSGGLVQAGRFAVTVIFHISSSVFSTPALPRPFY